MSPAFNELPRGKRKTKIMATYFQLNSRIGLGRTALLTCTSSGIARLDQLSNTSFETLENSNKINLRKEQEYVLEWFHLHVFYCQSVSSQCFN